MIIVIEGVDASGKSTLCKNLQTIYGGIVYATPPERLRRERENIDRFATPLASFQFYRKGIEVATQEILELEKQFDFIFVDRFWISTVATHKAMGIDMNIYRLAKLDCTDTTILLTVNQREQIRRFQERGMSTGDRNLLSMFHAIDANFKHLVRNHCHRYRLIDTTYQSSDDTSEQAISHLRI